jgi:hypothetical protein
MVHTMLDKFSVFNTTIILTHNQIIKLNWFDISDKKKRGLVSLLLGTMAPRRNSRYRRSNQNPQIKEGQTPQWSKEKEQKDKQQTAMSFVLCAWSVVSSKHNPHINFLYWSQVLNIPCLTRSASRNCSPFRSTWVHPWFLVGLVFLDL